MLERGFSYGRRGFISLSLPLGEREIDGFAAVAGMDAEFGGRQPLMCDDLNSTMAELRLWDRDDNAPPRRRRTAPVRAEAQFTARSLVREDKRRTGGAEESRSRTAGSRPLGR